MDKKDSTCAIENQKHKHTIYSKIRYDILKNIEVYVDNSSKEISFTRRGYKIKVNVEIEECSISEFGYSIKKENGCFEMDISEEQAISIDNVKKHF